VTGVPRGCIRPEVGPGDRPRLNGNASEGHQGPWGNRTPESAAAGSSGRSGALDRAENPRELGRTPDSRIRKRDLHDRATREIGIFPEVRTRADANALRWAVAVPPNGDRRPRKRIIREADARRLSFGLEHPPVRGPTPAMPPRSVIGLHGHLSASSNPSPHEIHEAACVAVRGETRLLLP
jgi:hypothetical protein